jgi:serine/threonine protein kinase
MIDDELETHRWPDGTDVESPETQADDSLGTRADDPLATRCPEPGDEFATRVDPGMITWADSAGFSQYSGAMPVGACRYRIIRAHARGALGEVFLARDEELKREVALKEIQERYADDPGSRSRFIVEAEVTGGLEHPGIVPVYGLGHHPDGRPYYAMRFVRGGCLKEAIDRHYRVGGPRPDPVEQAIAFRKLLARFLGVCNAIAYAHSRGVLHRDLKPGNVMLGPYGETLVVDWGLAKSMAETLEGSDVPTDLIDHEEGFLRPMSDESSPSATMKGSIVGTPAFMSPEQARGDLDCLGPMSDVYSLGATLYYLLTGKVAFEGRDVEDILRRVKAGEFPPPGKVRKGVPRALEAIALKAMSLRPEDRYPTAKGLATDVEQWLAGASVSAYRDWYVVRLWRWCLRRPILATAGLSCLFFDLCLLVILLLIYIQSVLHAGWMAQWNLAAGLLVLVPFVGQLGAMIGSGAGAVIGLATRRTRAGLQRGAALGLKFGVPTALLALLGSGAFEVAHPPSWTNLASWIAPPDAADDGWPRLPGALTAAPRWIKKAGAPVEIASFFDEPPADDNAASSYLDALIEFDDGMTPCFPPGEGNRRGAIALSRKERLRTFDDAWKLDPDSVDRVALDALLHEYKIGFMKLRDTQETFHRCVFRTGLGYQAKLPHADAALEVNRVVALQVRRELERGEIDRAIHDFQTLLRLARDIRSRGVLNTQKTSLAIEESAEFEILLPILRQPGLNVEQADRLLAILQGQSSEGLDPFLEGFRAEYIRFGQTLHAYFDPLIGEDPAGSNPLGSLLGYGGAHPLDKATERKLRDLVARTPPREFIDAAHRAYDEFHRTLQTHNGKALLDRIDQLDRLPPRSMAPRHHQVLSLAPDGGAFLKHVGNAETTRNAMKCLVALRRWELAGHPLSADLNLEEVVKAAGMAKIPADPFHPDGGPLKLKISQGEAIIESVGLETRKNRSYRLKPSSDRR